MTLSAVFERLIALAGEPGAGALGGLVIGMVFGIAAQQSRFCLRAATVEFGRDVCMGGFRPAGIGPRSSVWLLTFGTALFWTQLLRASGLVDLSEARMLAVPGSISGAIVGGLMFGAGMVLARGCSGRMLVLAATGNLRMLLSGLVFAVTAQMSLHGFLAPVRSAIAGLWTTAPYTGGRNIELAAWLGLGRGAGLLLGSAAALVALVFAIRNRVGLRVLVMASGVGFAIPLAWIFTASLVRESFDPVTIEAITFTGPSAATLMFFLEPARELSFQTGLIPGVFLGAFLAAAATGELRLQGFEGGASMRRYLFGAALMGMGGMLAGGCAIGAGVSGTSVLSLTAWIALTGMWAGAIVTDALLDAPTASAAVPS